MAARRVFLAALCLSAGAALGPSSSAYADTSAAGASSSDGMPSDTPPPAPTDSASGGDESAEASPGQDVPVGVAADAYADTDPSALTDFRGALDPYGRWVDDPNYGTVWTPNPDEIGQDFAPYVSSGHWAYDGDYVWVSDYAWGWVAFHYGRWVWIREMGWAWVPGRVYAPAWVVWRMGSEEYAYLGWAPMPPAWAWRDGVAEGMAFAAWEPFVFCPRGDVFSPAVATRVVAGPAAVAIAHHTRPYVRASPVVAGRALAQPVMHGPELGALGIAPSRVVRLTAAAPELGKAKLLARPSTAQALGARPPVPHIVRPRPIFVPQYQARPLAVPRAPPRRR
jgi:hypothetical protein